MFRCVFACVMCPVWFNKGYFKIFMENHFEELKRLCLVKEDLCSREDLGSLVEDMKGMSQVWFVFVFL